MEGGRDGSKNGDGSPPTLPKLRWLQGLLSSSLLRPPPLNAQQWQVEVVAYTELFGQFASETFSDDLSELARSHYPQDGPTLLDDVLATFVLHHPEHTNSVLHALLSCIIDGTFVYNCKSPPFGSFVALFSASNERLFMEQWALACAEILRVLTHYNRPIYANGNGGKPLYQRDGSRTSSGSGSGDSTLVGGDDRTRRGKDVIESGCGATSSVRPSFEDADGGGARMDSTATMERGGTQGTPCMEGRSEDGQSKRGQVAEDESTGRESPPGERRNPIRPLTKWITDCLLAAPPTIRSDYFRWCGGVTGKYATGGALRPPTTVLAGGGGRGGKNPQQQLQPSTRRWAMANGAAVILSVCDDEVQRYDTADLTALAVPCLLLPPPDHYSAMDEQFTAGLPSLEPFARLFHRYYALSTPAATQRLLLGLLEAPQSWAPDALDAVVQLIELIRGAAATNDGGPQLPPSWLHLHFLQPMGVAMASWPGIAADAAAGVLFRIFSEPTLLFSSPSHHHHHHHHDQPGLRSGAMGTVGTTADAEAFMSVDMTARGLAALMCGHGKDVEWRICALLETVFGLLPLDASTVALPDILGATEIQLPVLTWSLFRPLLRLLEYLPRGSPSQACIRRIFSATVRAVLQRTFPKADSEAEAEGAKSKSKSAQAAGKQMGTVELRSMVHCLFTEPCPSPAIASLLISDMLTACLSHDSSSSSTCTSGPQMRSRALPSSAVNIPSPQRFLPQVSNTAADAHCQNTGSEARDLSTGNTTLPKAEGAATMCKGGGSGEGGWQRQNGQLQLSSGKATDRGVVATVDSYIVATVCALACEVQLLSLSSAIFTAVRTTPPPASAAGGGAGNSGDGTPGAATVQAQGQGQGESGGVRGSERVGDGPIGGGGGGGNVLALQQTMNGRPVSSVVSAAENTRRVLSLLEMLLALVPGGGGAIGVIVAEPSSGEIVAAAVVAAHVSSLLARSRASMHALAAITRCRSDPIIRDMASKVMVLVEKNNCAVAATMAPQQHQGGVGQRQGTPDMECCMAEDNNERGAGRSDSDTAGVSGCVSESRHGSAGSGCGLPAGEGHKRDVPREWQTGRDAEWAFKGQSGGLWRGKESWEGCHHHHLHHDHGRSSDAAGSSSSGTGVVAGVVDASDVATLLLCRNGRMGRHWGGPHGGDGESHEAIGGRSIGGGSLMALLMEKQQLALAAVPLLWQRLMSAPEVPLSSEGTSAERGWRQVLEALCNVVIAFPQQAAAALVAKAEMELGRWEGEEDMAAVLRGNARIVSLLTKILRLHRCPPAVRVVAQARSLLHRATSGIGLDGEACTLPQLELLESAITAADVARLWGGGQEVAEQLLDLLKDRLPETVRCLSSNSAHVRALSMALLRHLAYEASLACRSVPQVVPGLLRSHASCNGSCQEQQHARPAAAAALCSAAAAGMEGVESGHKDEEERAHQDREESDAQDWRRAVEQCLSWEAHFRKAGGLSTSLLIDAASSLGCQIPA